MDKALKRRAFLITHNGIKRVGDVQTQFFKT